MATSKSKVAAAKKLAQKIKSKKTTSYKKQGQAAPQSSSYKPAQDKKVAAKPVGHRWTDAGAARLGKDPKSTPSKADVAKYGGRTFKFKGEDTRYIYSENRVDKSDKSLKNKFQGGGKVTEGKVDIKFKGKTYSFDAQFYDGELEDIDIMPAYKLDSPLFEAMESEFDDWFENYADRDTKDMYEEGYLSRKGAIKESISMIAEYMVENNIKSFDLSKNWSEIDIEGGAYQYQEGGTLGAGSFKLGGGLGVKGRQKPNYRKDIDAQKEAKPAGWRFTDKLAKRLGKSSTARPTAEEIKKYRGKGVYFERRQDKADAKPSKRYISLETGGDLDAGEMQGAGMFAGGGGVGVSGRQYSPYRKDLDAQKEAKPAGWRFTDSLAKRLGKSSTARPTVADIEKYAGKGVYFERREDKADAKPSKRYISLETGGDLDAGQMQGAGMFAGGGGVHRVSNRESREYSENMLPFKANNLEGKTLSNGDYAVISYGYYPIWYYSKKESKWYGNKDKYSVTTAKHISQSRPTYDAEMLGKSELLDKMMSHSASFENGGAIDVLSDAAYSPVQTTGGTGFSTGDLTSHMTMDNLAS